jgi:hypothetical protein
LDGGYMSKSPVPSSFGSSLVGSAVDVAHKARTLPVGALLGLCLGILLTGTLHYTLSPRIPLWLLSLVVPFGTAGGIGIQKFLHWKYGWKLDTELHRARAKHDTDLKLEELHERVDAGVLTPEQAQKLGVQIAREGLLGPPKGRGPRPPRRRKDPPQPPLAPAA